VTVESFTVDLDENSQVIQTTKTESIDGKERSLTTRYVRNAAGGVSEIQLNSSGLRSTIKVTLDDQGREISSEILNGEGVKTSSREVDWAQAKITLHTYDAEGKVSREFTTKYLKLTMQQGLLRTHFAQSYKQSFVGSPESRRQLKGNCDTTNAVIKCAQELFLGESSQAAETIESSLRLIEFDNGVYKYVEALTNERATKFMDDGMLAREEVVSRRFGDRYSLQQETVLNKPVGGDQSESVTKYFYNENGSLNYEETYIGGTFTNRKEYSY